MSYTERYGEAVKNKFFLVSCCGDTGIFSVDGPNRERFAVRLGQLVEDKLGVNGGKARNGLGAENNMIPCIQKVGCEQMLVWQTPPTEVNGYKKILQSLGAKDNMVESFDALAKEMIEYAVKLTYPSRDENAPELKGQLLGAKLQMSCDSRRKEMVMTRPRVDVGFEDLCDLHEEHKSHVFRVLIPLDDCGVWQNLYRAMSVGNACQKLLAEQGTTPTEPHPSAMLYVAKESYAIIPVELMFAENVRTSINGNKHMEMYLMLFPDSKDSPVLKTENPEYYCWGEMNTDGGVGRTEDRGMVVYPYDDIAEKDRNIVAGRGLNNVVQTFCLLQDVEAEKELDRKERLERWNFSEEMDIVEQPDEENQQEDEGNQQQDEGNQQQDEGNETDTASGSSGDKAGTTTEMKWPDY
jgi:hypothetical protein